MRIHEVKGAGNGANDHAHYLQGEEKVWEKPSIRFDVLRRPAKTIKSNPTHDELDNDEYNAKLGLVDSLVLRIMIFVVQSVNRPDSTKPSTAPMNGPVYM